MGSITYTATPGSFIPKQPWWEALHRMINTSFEAKPVQLFPEEWKRLPTHSEEAALSLKGDLGEDGLMSVAFADGEPIACAGAAPFRGFKLVERQHPNQEDVSSSPSPPETTGHADWEILYFCISPSHRGKGLSTPLLKALSEAIVPLGAKRLLSNYVIAETGDFWPRLGFTTIPGYEGIIRKGHIPGPDLPALEWEIHTRMGVRDV